MNTPINFELAKLLKEKGYRILPDFKSSYPTISDVVMWLYEKHGIWIECYMDDDNTFGYLISRITKEGRIDSPLKRQFNSPTEVYESAIEYALKNLI